MTKIAKWQYRNQHECRDNGKVVLHQLCKLFGELDIDIVNNINIIKHNWEFSLN